MNHQAQIQKRKPGKHLAKQGLKSGETRVKQLNRSDDE
ncbi:hypothetical protein Nstercoris_02278 (plasmid) [Nitrosomonas stercoris]|uniref:Uncharacterized protein n=1 Tax=Nitrosomonas stercoris TaxID=1444684 RepID=A0A4Y1YQG5_9PROT|nr:hypothetical protein Nstercoris_02278 [Nitrosomonas stercoris]